MKIVDILNELSNARAEFSSENNSVYNKFVVPYFIDKCDIRKESHSIALVGSRGSGKSTYIQYFCHATRFDTRKENIPEDEFDCIVFYWKPDTAYCQGLKREWLGNDADLFFKVHAATSLLTELSSMIKNVLRHYQEVQSDLAKGGMLYEALSLVTKESVTSLDDIENIVSRWKYEVSTRLNPVNTEGLLSIEPMEMMVFLLEALRKDCQLFSSTSFKIFVDEFELLNNYQQKVINTYRKESKKLINWNVAYKKNAKPTPETISDQWLQKPDDYREIDLDEMIRGDFKIFAAEILILSFQSVGLDCLPGTFNAQFLGERRNIDSRRKSEYRSEILRLIERILPTPSIKQLSELCLSKSSVSNEVKRILSENNAPQGTIQQLMDNPSLAITLLGINQQKSFNLSDFIEDTDPNNASKAVKEKINTYEFNTLLHLNLRWSSLEVPVYAGFERFVAMTSSNIRHFKELCFNTIKQFNENASDIELNSVEDLPIFPYECMHAGAILTSRYLVDEIASYPPYGKKLSQMVNRIGEIFRVSQKTTYQTEPERTIFIIEYDFSGDDVELESFIESALSWRVLVDDSVKRLKSENNIIRSREFQLNPIYSPRFGVSYRKKRDVVFTAEAFKQIIGGPYSLYELLLKEYRSKWKLETDSANQGSLW